MFEAVERLSLEETSLRHARLRKLLSAKSPAVRGVLVFSQMNIYYLTGIFTSGVLWIPMQGEAVLWLRKGGERAKLETSLKNIYDFTSYGDLLPFFAEHGIGLGSAVGVEMSGLTWAMSNKLRAKLKNIEFVDITNLINKCRSVKTEYELQKMRIAGQRHAQSYEAFSAKVKHGMTERELSILMFNEFLERGHAGIVRSSSLGVENVLGQLGVGDNSNYPIVRDSPSGSVGCHPATPYLGGETKWEKHSLLMVDLAFCYEGYASDKTQVYWSGSKKSVPDEIKRAYDFCVEVQNTAANTLIAGELPERIWQKSFEMAKDAGYSENYMGFGGNQVKFLGHGIGLCLDEYPPLANKFVEPLEVGMLIALEPKLGLKGLGMVGIENVFEITEHGAKSLTGNDFEMICID